MTENNTQAAGRLSRLTAELEALRKENETLLEMVLIAAKQRDKYAAIEAENKALKQNWRMTYAGQAMQAQLAQIDPDDDSNYKAIAYDAFCAADAMIEFVDEQNKL